MTPGMEVITTGTGAALAPSPTLHLSPSPSLCPSLDQVREYIRASKAENTLRAIRAIGARSAHGLRRAR